MKEHSMQRDIRERVQKAWDDQEPIYKRLHEAGAQRFMQELPEIAKAFLPPEVRSLFCIDEGVTDLKSKERVQRYRSFIPDEPGSIHTAGSGILRPKEEVIAMIREKKIQRITTHDGCGAAALAGIDPKVWGKEIAEQTGIEYAHISAAEMKRPLECHYARCAYIVGPREGFEWGRVAGLPPGFTITVDGTFENDALLALQIATSDHGFGNPFSEGSPFMFILITDPRDSSRGFYRLQESIEAMGLKTDQPFVVDDFSPDFL